MKDRLNEDGNSSVISRKHYQRSGPLEDRSLTSHRSKAYTFSCSILIGGRLSSSGAGTPKDSCDPLYARFNETVASSLPIQESEDTPASQTVSESLFKCRIDHELPFRVWKDPKAGERFQCFSIRPVVRSVYSVLFLWGRNER